ncbi:tyrosine-type recombinase/integrase [Loigolactobacillus zhaoyuanensis]|uniref:tyrosine-type recombinase/integrase n=1 Tax=Loigolactobacillus zhaoyuanensis TaxID=2486017 RepID=UPI000F73FE15|nr:site-specific integrase [Loigolactobacillus zhaoyuanensis]
MSFAQTEYIAPVSEKWFNSHAKKFNRKKIDEYLLHSPRLSPATLTQYRSCLRIFAYWIYKYCGNKKIIDLKIRDGKAYQDWLVDHNGSSTNINVKLAAASELCEYIEKYYEDEYPLFRNPIRKGRERVVKTARKEKHPLEPDEVAHLLQVLHERGQYQRECYLALSYQTACRRAESAQFKRLITDYTDRDAEYFEYEGERHKYYLSNSIRCKGPGRQGKVRQFKLSVETLGYIKQWDDQRRYLVAKKELRDDADGLFVHIDSRGVKNLTPAAFAYWCEGFGDIVGRKLHPHDLRTSRATNLVVYQKKPLSAVSVMMGHKSEETTKVYYVITNDRDSDAALL